MICRLIRQLRGKGKRAAAAEELFARHHPSQMKIIGRLDRKVNALEELVEALKKDITSCR